jgi:hypothetical protein
MFVPPEESSDLIASLEFLNTGAFTVSQIDSVPLKYFTTQLAPLLGLVVLT